MEIIHTQRKEHGQYAAFGYVTSGMDIVDTICKTAEPTDSNGSITPEEQPVITSIAVLIVADSVSTQATE